MKAILIIDIYDEVTPKEFVTAIRFSDGDYMYCNTKLKPTPKRKEVRKVKYINDVVHIQTTYDYLTNKIHGQVIYDVERIFAEGYNACLDEILGGVENE